MVVSRPRSARALRMAMYASVIALLFVLLLPRHPQGVVTQQHGAAEAPNNNDDIMPPAEPKAQGPDTALSGGGAGGEDNTPAPVVAHDKGAGGDDEDDDALAKRRRPRKDGPRDPDADCTVVTDVIPRLDELGRQFFSGFGGQYPQCMPMLPAVRKFLPFRYNSPHPRCATARLPPESKLSITGAWKNLDEHMAYIDWEEVAGWKSGAPFLFSRCRPPVAINHWYFDVNPFEGATGSNSVDWFLRHYPSAETFGVHVLSWDRDGFIEGTLQALAKRGVTVEAPHGEVSIYPKSLTFRLGLPWLQLGYLSQRVLQEATLPPPTLPPGAAVVELEPGNHAVPGAKGDKPATTAPPDGTNPRDAMVDVLNDRMLPTVYHETEDVYNKQELADKAKKLRDKLAVKYPKMTRTLRAVPLSHWIFEYATEADFVVLRLNALGFEREAVQNLLETGAMRFVDEVFLVCRCREKDFAWNTPTTPADCQELLNTLRTLGVYVHEWFAW